MDTQLDAELKAKILVEALPYIQKYYGQTVVVKYGGNAMINEELKDAVIHDLVLLNLVGIKVVVVHGGGPEISEMLKKIGKESKFVNGLRDGRNNRDIPLFEHVNDWRWINVHNVAHVAVIRTRAVGQALGLEHAAVHAAEADAASSCLFQQRDKVFVDLAAQHHLYDIHSLTVLSLIHI